RQLEILGEPYFAHRAAPEDLEQSIVGDGLGRDGSHGEVEDYARAGPWAKRSAATLRGPPGVDLRDHLGRARDRLRIAFLPRRVDAERPAAGEPRAPRVDARRDHVA